MADDYIEPPAAEDPSLIARLAGYAWDEISAFVDGGTSEALDAGYTSEEIDQFLGRGDAERAQARTQGDWSERVAGDEQLVTGLRGVSHDKPLSWSEALDAERVAGYARKDTPGATGDYVEAPPAGAVQMDEYARGSYANAFLRGEVRSPLEWAERYVGAAWNALGDVDPAAMVRSAGQIAASLPTPEDLTDAAIATLRQQGVTDPDTGEVRYTRAKIADTWAETGEPLMSLYERANADPGFAAELTTPPAPEPQGPIEKVLTTALELPLYAINELWPRATSGAVDTLGGAAQFAEKIVESNPLGGPFLHEVYNAYNAASKTLPIGEAHEGMVDEIVKERAAHAKAEGADEDWIRWGGQVAVTAPLFTTLGLQGAWAVIAAGASGGAIAGAFHPSTAEDYWTKKAEDIGVGAASGAALGAGLVGLGKVISKMAPAAADMLRRVIGKTSEPEVLVIDPSDAAVPAIRTKASEALAVPKPAEPPLPKAAVEGVSPEPVSPLDFTPEAKPAEKMQSISRAWQEARLGERADVLEDLRLRNEGIIPDEFDHDFFTRLAAKQDAATVALAEGMDGARGFLRYIADLGRQIVTDESGALNVLAVKNTFTTQAGRDARAQFVATRNFSQDLLRSGMGTSEQLIRHFGSKFDQRVPTGNTTWWGGQQTTNLHKLVAPHMAEWEAEIAKGPAGNAARTMIGNLIEYVEGRSLGTAMRHDSPLTPVADAIRGINQEVARLMRDAEARGLHTMTSYYEDYFRHLWKDPVKADKVFQVSRGGSGASFNERTIPTTMDGIARGLEPKFLNPIEMTMYDVAEKVRYIKTLEMIDAGKNKLSPVMGTPMVYFAHAAKNPGDRQLIGPGTVKRVPVAGMGELKAFAADGFATPWNNTMEAGFFSRQATGDLFQKLLYVKNLNTQTQLVNWLYHAWSISGELLAGGFSNALQEMAGAARFAFKGQFGPALRELGLAGYDTAAATLKVPKLVENYIRGNAAIKGFADLSTDPAIKALTEVNFRFGKRQEIYRFGSAPTLMESLRRGSLWNEYREAFTKLLGDPKTETVQYRAAAVPLRRMWGFAGHEVGRVMNTVSAPLFDYVIPAYKAGVALERMRTFLRQNPNATPEVVNFRARQIANNTDDRLGEMNLDNVFWPRAVKQAAQVSMISPGWVYGEIRFAMAAAGVNIERKAFEWNPIAMSNFIGFAMAHSLHNSIAQYLYTGEMPRDWKDVVIGPRTGGVTASGAAERALMPGKVKEIFDWGKIIATSMQDVWKAPGAIAHYFMGKGIGVVQMLRGIVSGEDAIGHKIAQTAGGYPAFLLKNMMPIFTNSMADRKVGTGMAMWQTLLGFRPVPTFAADPEKFYKGLEAVDLMHAREEYRRALRENAQLETPRDLPELPPDTSAKGHQIRQSGVRVLRGESAGGGQQGGRERAGGSPGVTVLRGGGESVGGTTVLRSPSSRAPRASRAGQPAYTPWRNRRRASRRSRTVRYGW